MGKLTWPQALVIATVVIVMGGLAYFEKGFDTVGLLGILAALGWVATKQGEHTAATQAVKEQTNGTQTKMLQMLEDQGKLLAKMQPPPEEDPKV